MRLESLTVQGFKSFADRTVFRFDGSGLTAIVGPNGCGKSNVLEAIKWVLGEQRPTSLRSREMTDVIFNGTSRRPPMGLCRVTLVFDNSDKTLPIDADKVEIFRQVTRAGETAYAINRMAVRLKDIRQLFAGSGLGAGGYGFMEQGKIDSVLASNPHDRRKVFEEAAGISRFRAQRHETELKLDKVEQNMTRLADIVDEVTRQIRSLKIHAGKARNHRAMSARLDACGKAFCVHRFGELETERLALEERLQGLEATREEATTRRDQLREEAQSAEERVQIAQEELSDLRTARAELQGSLNAAREKLSFEGDYVQELQSRREKVRSGLEAITRDLERTAEERLQVEADFEAVLAREAEVMAAVQTQQSASQDVRARADALERACIEVERRLAIDERRVIELGREEARAEAELEGLEQRRYEAEERLQALEEEIQALEDSAGAALALSERSKAAAAEARAGLSQASETLSKADAKTREARKAVQAAREARDRAHSRQRALEGVLARRDGLEEGPKRLLDLQKRAPERLQGLRGLAIEQLEFTDTTQASILQAALGDAAHALLVDTVQDALRALDVARQEGFEGVLILPLEMLPTTPPPSVRGVRALNPEGERVLAALFGDLEVVPASEFEGRLLRERSGPRPLLVSEDGRTRRERWLLTPGRRQGSGLVHLQAEAQGLARELPLLVETLDEAEGVLSESEAALAAARESRAAAEQALGAAEREAQRTSEAHLRAAREAARLSSEGDKLEAKVVECESRLDSVKSRQIECAKARATAAESLENDRQTLAEEREKLTAFARERELASEALEAVRIEAAEIAARRRHLQERRQSLAEREAELSVRKENDARQIEELTHAGEKSSEDLVQLREEIASFESREERIQHAFEEAERGTLLARQELQDLVAALRKAESDSDQSGEALGSARGREGKLLASREALLERATNELQIPDLPGFVAQTEARLAELRMTLSEGEETAELFEDSATEAPEPEVATPDTPPEEATAVVAADPSEPAEATDEPPPSKLAPKIPAGATLLEALLLDESTNWSLVEKEIRTLRDRIARLGNVNLAAVEELEDAERRSALIFAEKEDLETSRAKLAKILKNLEQESTALFLQTFEAVREHFADIFRRLFGGGKAVMTLENPDAPLESGIEIKACPPGKEFRSITLLSGGERTMTAVALLFAIFRANPAPCAFLDEVDAALDEDNIERFCRMVKDFTDRSQFVVVTHSKRTMEAADLLYGVTMPERGVSRPVKVRLEHLDDQGHIRDVEALNREAAEEARGQVASEQEPSFALPTHAEKASLAPAEPAIPAQASIAATADPSASADDNSSADAAAIAASASVVDSATIEEPEQGYALEEPLAHLAEPVFARRAEATRSEASAPAAAPIEDEDSAEAASS